MDVGADVFERAAKTTVGGECARCRGRQAKLEGGSYFVLGRASSRPHANESERDRSIGNGASQASAAVS